MTVWLNRNRLELKNYLTGLQDFQDIIKTNPVHPACHAIDSESKAGYHVKKILMRGIIYEDAYNNRLGA